MQLTDLAGQIRVVPASAATEIVAIEAGAIVTLNLRQGESALLQVEGRDEPVIAPVAPTTGVANFYGSHAANGHA